MRCPHGLLSQHLLCLNAFICVIATAVLAQAAELCGIVAVQELSDTAHLDFSVLDTPRCEVSTGPDTNPATDLTLIRLRFVSSTPMAFRARTPFTPSLDSHFVDMQPFIEAFGWLSSDSAVDSLRRLYLPAMRAVNPECRQSGECDSSGAGFFVRTSEGGVAFWRPVSAYMGGIDRYFLFWAYSSDGTFGGQSAVSLPSGALRWTSGSTRPGPKGLWDLDLRGRIAPNKRPAHSPGPRLPR